MRKYLVSGLFLIGLLIAGSSYNNSDHIFSHKFHAEEAGAECDACHNAALESSTGADNLYPNHDNCYACHDEEDTECGYCHKNADDPVALERIETYSRKFSHKLHLENGAECLTCHAGIDQKEDASAAMHLPDMDHCMTCHQTPAEMDGCYTCHESDDILKPADHGLAWIESHGMYSETNAQNCESCHQQSYCIECHQGKNLFNESHPADFIVTHSISYLSRETNCGSCHQSRDYCIDCHININYVIPASHTLANWTGQAHAREARMDYDRCSVCHVQGDPNCTTCHN
ncbi:MAG: hypothetical protein JXR46_16565 [Calditrichaceae bacterium]|nr:hypothetical protein [Calditrichaceae bacterium]